MSKAREMNTLLEVCLVAAGGDLRAVPKASRVSGFILEWALATRTFGHDPGIEELGKWWKGSEKRQRTASRRLAEFRELFPGESTPERFAALLLEKENRELSPLVRVAV